MKEIKEAYMELEKAHKVLEDKKLLLKGLLGGGDVLIVPDLRDIWSVTYMHPSLFK